MDRIVGKAGITKRSITEERVGDRLAETKAKQHLPQCTAALLIRAETAMHGGVGHQFAELVVAEVTRDFFDNVDLGAAVGTPRRQVHREHIGFGGNDIETDRRDQRSDLRRVERGAKDAVHLTDAHLNRTHLRRQRTVLRIDGASMNHQIGAGLAQQFDKASLRHLHAVRVDTSLETTRRFRAQAQAVHRAGHCGLFEVGNLERNCRGCIGDLAVKTAHHAADTDGCVVGIADQQVVGAHRALDSIERDDCLVGSSQPNAESAATKGVEVVCMIGLVEFEHDVVAHVDHVVDGSHSGGTQSSAHPLGRRPHLYSGEHQRGESWTPFAIDKVDSGCALNACRRERLRQLGRR